MDPKIRFGNYLLDTRLGRIDQPLGLFDPAPARRTKMYLHHPRIGDRKEVRPDHLHQQKRDHQHRQYRQQDRGRILQTVMQHPPIPLRKFPKPPVPPLVEVIGEHFEPADTHGSFHPMIFVGHQHPRQHRNKRSRQDIAGHHRNDHRQGHGLKQIFGRPRQQHHRKNTIQIASVAISAGTAICCAPSRIAIVSGLCRCIFRWIFSTSTWRHPPASDRQRQPPSVMMLRLFPVSFKKMIPTKMDKGIDVQTITMLRQLPKKKRIISDTNIAPVTASCSTLSMEFSTNTD